MHFRKAIPTENQVTNEVFYDNQVTSVLDVVLSENGHRKRNEPTPLPLHSFPLKSEYATGRWDQLQTFPHHNTLKHLGTRKAWGCFLPVTDRSSDWRGGMPSSDWPPVDAAQTEHAALVERGLTQALILLCACWIIYVGNLYHILGTDQAGTMFCKSIKGIRTGVLLGTSRRSSRFPSRSAGPQCGVASKAGWMIWFSTFTPHLSSIPGILLIAASVLLFRSTLDLNPDFSA